MSTGNARKESESENGEFVAKRTKIYNDTGHTSVPKEVREKLDLGEGDYIGWVGYEDKIMLVKVADDE